MSASVRWSKARAREYLTSLHFSVGDIAEYFRRLGSVQYDPLKPVGRNVDLVFQSRVDGYRVDDWEARVYGHSPRLYYDAWDKQACLVPMADWPYRKLYHSYFYEIWWPRIFDPYATAVQRVEAALLERGPSSVSDLADLRLPGSDDGKRKGSWFGAHLVNHVLKALWYTGRITTHHRVAGRHVYAAAASVVPPELLAVPSPDRLQNLEWLVLRRHQAAGLLRPGAGKHVFSLPVEGAPTREIIDRLVERGELVSIDVEGVLFHAVRAQMERYANGGLPGAVHEPPSGNGKTRRVDGAVHGTTVNSGTERSLRFLAPLDTLLWDRKAVLYLYDFDYTWEVYKPAEKRRYGYYVLPVMYGSDRFVLSLADALRAFCAYAGATTGTSGSLRQLHRRPHHWLTPVGPSSSCTCRPRPGRSLRRGPRCTLPPARVSAPHYP